MDNISYLKVSIVRSPKKVIFIGIFHGVVIFMFFVTKVHPEKVSIFEDFHICNSSISIERSPKCSKTRFSTFILL